MPAGFYFGAVAQSGGHKRRALTGGRACYVRALHLGEPKKDGSNFSVQRMKARKVS